MGAVRAEHRLAGSNPEWREHFSDSIASESWSEALLPVVTTLLAVSYTHLTLPTIYSV